MVQPLVPCLAWISRGIWGGVYLGISIRVAGFIRNPYPETDNNDAGLYHLIPGCGGKGGPDVRPAALMYFYEDSSKTLRVLKSTLVKNEGAGRYGFRIDIVAAQDRAVGPAIIG